MQNYSIRSNHIKLDEYYTGYKTYGPSRMATEIVVDAASQYGDRYAVDTMRLTGLLPSSMDGSLGNAAAGHNRAGGRTGGAMPVETGNMLHAAQ